MTATCESCRFPAGARTGTINAYRYTGPAMENAEPGATYRLCDDCVRAAVEQFGSPLQRIDEDDAGRFCPTCDADLIGNDPHAAGCPEEDDAQ